MDYLSDWDKCNKMVCIQIIEDEAALRSEIAERFMFEGFDTIESGDGEAGIQDALQHHPDLILCDIWMPHRDGFGVLEFVRSQPELSHIPFIVMTSLVDDQVMQRVYNLGANHFINKPFSFPELLKVIARHTSNGTT
jgi:CheY-like chemotaxis protein